MIKRGLTSLSTEQLKHVLKLIYTGLLPCPFSRQDLLVRGLNGVAEEGDLLFNLEQRAAQSVLIAVLSERMMFARQPTRRQR